MEKEISLFGKDTKCVYCDEKMSFFEVIKHEDKCRKKKKLCDGYGNCRKEGIFILTEGKEKYRYCPDCLKRFKKEHPEIKFNMGATIR